jgi:hypothetical protein
METRLVLARVKGLHASIESLVFTIVERTVVLKEATSVGSNGP